MGRFPLVRQIRRILKVCWLHSAIRGDNILRSSAILVIGLAIVACGTTSPAVPTGTVPAISSSAEPAATETPITSATPVPVATGTETATSTPITPTASPTSALTAACNGAPASVSPDGKWVLCDAKDANGLSIPYAVSASGKRWEVALKKIAGPMPVYEDNQVLTWTPDGHYVYAMVHGITTGVGRFFYSGSDIWRMDLTSGAIQDLTPNYTFESNFYDVAVAPDGRRLAFVEQWMPPLTLDLLDLPGDKKTEIKLADTKLGEDPAVTAGELHLTPDGKRLVYKTLTVHRINQCAYVYSIKIMELDNQSTQTVLGDQSIALCNGEPEEYHILQVDNQQIILEHKGDMWRYDIATNKLELQASVTATP